MKRQLFLTVAMILGIFNYAAPDNVEITPKPAKTEFKGGISFVINSKTTLFVNAPVADSVRIADYVLSQWPAVKPVEKKTKNQIRFEIDSTKDFKQDAYTLSVDKNVIDIKAGSGAGLFYGLQSLLQLESGNTVSGIKISDAPRFEYRGLLLDVSRHFRDKNFVKKQLDAMAKLKLNKLHLHLTDAAGWRLQIDRYPLLTELAAWRDGETWKEWNAAGNKYLHYTDSSASGGFYTKDDIREILNYAADRYITVIPEIEMPSHSEEVIAAYPLLGCTKTPYTTSDFCPGSEMTYEFLENVLDEVIDLFPSHYINIGGDEAPKTKWRTCSDCQARIKAENLAGVDELQSYLVHRIERYLNSKGRALIGWDEIMQGGLSPTATVVSWRGTDGGIAAASQGNDAVMAPGKFCYFDGYQDAPSTQPEAIGGYLPLEMVYGYNPAPDTLADSVKNHIKGVEGTLFAEYIPTAEHAEYMLYPRAIALAEVAWTPQNMRDYADFRPRALAMSDNLKACGYNVFDLRKEVGNRPESKDVTEHLAKGKPVKYNVDWWKNYPAAGANTLTDGLRGGWNYNDLRWQGFNTQGRERVDVTIDLKSVQPISYVGADFMQICGPDVWMPAQVIISVSSDGKEYSTLSVIDHNVVRDEEVSFKTFSWSGTAEARYVRYQALADHGILFTDEIIVR